jgi:hypothetical protein
MDDIDLVLAGWRAELTSEIGARAAELADARSAVLAAETAEAAATAEWRALRGRVLGLLHINEALAGALSSRLAAAEEARNSAAGAVSLSRGRLANIEARLVDLREAGAQLDRRAAPAGTADLDKVAPRRGAASIAVDEVIEFPVRRAAAE